MTETPRQWLYQVLENNRNGFIAHFINLGLMLLIALNVIFIVASTEASINSRFHVFFQRFEIFSLIIFTIEYLLRVWVSVERSSKDLKHPFLGRIRYIFQPMALVDLLAILPSFFILFGVFGNELLILRALRLVRIFKLTRYSRSMELLITVLKQEAETMISAIFVLTITIIISATGIYLVEGDVQPEAFGSIPRALWWATVTLTTVGYGDVVPITAMGRALGIVIVITGIGMAALPAGILASGFTSEISRRRERFKAAVMSWIEDGTFSEHENIEFTELRLTLGISRTDAALMIREARSEFKRNKSHQHICPECGHNLKQGSS